MTTLDKYPRVRVSISQTEKDKKMAKPNGHISKEMKREAIAYLFESGYIDDMTTDKRYFTTILLAAVANSMNIELVGLDLEHGGTKDV